jgi:hypothetical protein
MPSRNFGVPLAHRRQVGAAAVRHFGGHAHRLAQGRVGVDGLADVGRVGAHLDGQADLADHVAADGPTMVPPITRWVSASKISLVKP